MTRSTSVPELRPEATSTFVNGHFPRRRGLILLLSLIAGFGLTVIWSAEFVDSTIGGTVTDTVLGEGATRAPIAGVAAGIAFAFVSGLAGTFTACNIAAFGAVAPMLGSAGSRWRRLALALRPLGWLAAGMFAVSALYGVVVGIVGTAMPQFSTAPAVPGTLSARTVQSMVVFGLIGLVLLYLGLAALGYVRDPFRRVSARFPNAPTVFMGALIGAFLIGRPFPLFRQMFRDAAESHDPLYGAVVFSLQSLGNVVVLAVLFLALTLGAGDRLRRWLTADPRRLTVVVAVSLIVAGAFTFLYWDIRMLARREIIPWYPTAPWA